MYKVVGFYDDIYPMTWEESTLEGARQLQKELLELFEIVKIYHNGEEVEYESYKWAYKRKH